MFLIDAGLLKVPPATSQVRGGVSTVFSLHSAGLGLTRPIVITLSLMFLLTLCIFGSVYAVHLNRQLYTELESVVDKRDFYQAQWSQLLLEQSALTAPARVEQIARLQLDMKHPTAEELVVIKK